MARRGFKSRKKETEKKRHKTRPLQHSNNRFILNLSEYTIEKSFLVLIFYYYPLKTDKCFVLQEKAMGVPFAFPYYKQKNVEIERRFSHPLKNLWL